MFLFDDGRIAHTKNEANLIGKEYLEISVLPDVPSVDGKIGFCVADIKSGRIKVKYINAPNNPDEIDSEWTTIEPETYTLTAEEKEEMAIDTALNTEYLVCLMEESLGY